MTGPLPPIAAFDWPSIERALDTEGHAVLPGLLSPEACATIIAMEAEPAHFRKRVVMAQHGYGRGEYQYFSYPLPSVVASLRESLYARLVSTANRWNEALQREVRYPASHAAFLARCHAAGQRRATPLLLRYRAGDYNCLHQDIYGEHVFPLQVATLLSAPGQDFTGGEFVLTEQRPRRQSRAEVISLGQGDAVVFAVRDRPAAGPRGSHRVVHRHGVSRIHGGQRHTLGIIFHDAA